MHARNLSGASAAGVTGACDAFVWRPSRWGDLTGRVRVAAGQGESPPRHAEQGFDLDHEASNLLKKADIKNQKTTYFFSDYCS
ncbi:hypothetical protein [Pseudomonas sp. TMB3-21]